MGEVWQAYDEQLGRPVAVKMLLQFAPADERLQRFRREAMTGARLNHPGLTVVYDIGRHDDQLFIVMELLKGRDLARVLAGQPGGLPVSEAVDLVVQAAEALAAAHAHDVVHRDLKPGNLFLLTDGRLKICDFGIARTAEDTARLTATGQAIGTPPYMAPEQWRGEDVDARCDVYALGCVLYELLTGAPPFGAGGLPLVLMYSHLNETPPPLRTKRDGVPAHLDQLVVSMLAKDPAARPDAATVAERLRGAPSGKQRPYAVISLALAVVVLLAALAAVVWEPSTSRHSALTTPSPSASPTSSPSASPTPSRTGPRSPSPSTLPLSPDELLSTDFKDAGGADFLLAYNTTVDCSQASPSALVDGQFKADGCTTMMTADYLEQTRTTGGDSPILVSVEIIPFPTTADASKAYGLLYGADYRSNIWCPPRGVGQTPCAEKSRIDWKHETAGTIRHHNEYLIMAQALRTDHSSTANVWNAIVHASWAGVYASGPAESRGGSGELVSWY